MLAALVAVVGLGAPAASAHPATGVQNGVAAITPGTGSAVAAAPAVSPAVVGVSGPLFDDRALVSLVTPRAGARAAGLADDALPAALRGGATDVHVYYGVSGGKPVYTGITNNLARRQVQHGDRFVVQQVTSAPVTRGQARAIEQALIVRNPGFQNKINSISPNHSWYQEAVDWGEAWLRANGL
ncbi:hypothetical protein [Mycobacterium sp.]|uniref:hypothetical protein n=1 Tax=Mycobacterium sp. TaxID=1785 RepID=UPI003A868340